MQHAALPLQKCVSVRVCVDAVCLYQRKMFTHTNTHQTNEKYEVYKSALRRKLENRSGKTNNTDRHKHKHTPKDAHLALSAVSLHRVLAIAEVTMKETVRKGVCCVT